MTPDYLQRLTICVRRFLLAQLHLNSLVGKRSPKSIRSYLRELSSDVKKYESAYDDAMKRIQGQVPDKSEMAIQVLTWVSCAKRPLTTTELQTALAVEVGEPEFDPENLPDLDDMVSVCAGLVTVDEQSDIIRLVHYTRQEYFERTWAKWFPKAQEEIVQVCVAYLSLDIFKAEPWWTEIQRNHRGKIKIDASPLREYPLLIYAAEFWGHHVNEQLYYADSEVKDNRAIEFLSNNSQVNCCARVLLRFDLPVRGQDYHLRPMRYFDGDQYPLSRLQLATGLHLAVWFPMPNIIRKMISTGWEVDSKDACQRTPLFWAVRFGLLHIVSLLPESGTDLNMIDTDGDTPLHASA